MIELKSIYELYLVRARMQIAEAVTIFIIGIFAIYHGAAMNWSA